MKLHYYADKVIEGNELARRFDFLVYTVDLALLQSKDATKVVNGIKGAAEELSKLYNLPHKAKKYRKYDYIIYK